MTSHADGGCLPVDANHAKVSMYLLRTSGTAWQLDSVAWVVQSAFGKVPDAPEVVRCEMFSIVPRKL